MHMLQAQEDLSDPLVSGPRRLVRLPLLGQLLLFLVDLGQEVPANSELHHHGIDARVREVVHVEKLHDARMGDDADTVCHFALPSRLCRRRALPSLDRLDCIPSVGVLVLRAPHDAIAALAQHSLVGDVRQTPAARLGIQRVLPALDAGALPAVDGQPLGVDGLEVVHGELGLGVVKGAAWWRSGNRHDGKLAVADEGRRGAFRYHRVRAVASSLVDPGGIREEDPAQGATATACDVRTEAGRNHLFLHRGLRNVEVDGLPGIVHLRRGGPDRFPRSAAGGAVVLAL
mmetsp:Transcript_154101/g.493963  ORF Transcript_154101/g.493963 Transcript_154101/m.493963 type:complete len:287 (+) Transcript_154101:794-1654(+)